MKIKSSTVLLIFVLLIALGYYVFAEFVMSPQIQRGLDLTGESLKTEFPHNNKEAQVTALVRTEDLVAPQESQVTHGDPVASYQKKLGNDETGVWLRNLLIALKQVPGSLPGGVPAEQYLESLRELNPDLYYDRIKEGLTRLNNYTDYSLRSSLIDFLSELPVRQPETKRIALEDATLMVVQPIAEESVKWVDAQQSQKNLLISNYVLHSYSAFLKTSSSAQEALDGTIQVIRAQQHDAFLRRNLISKFISTYPGQEHDIHQALKSAGLE